MTGTGCAPFDVVRFEPKLERAVGQLAEAEVEEFVDRASVNELPIGDRIAHLALVAVEQYLDVRMGEQPLEHARVAVQRHRLVTVGEVAVVAVRARGHARRDRGVQLRWVDTPLLARVADGRTSRIARARPC